MNIELVEKFPNQNVLVFGDFMIDKYIDGSVRRISPEAPVPVLEVRSIEKSPGGAGNVVRNLRSLGAFVRVIGCIGDDIEGHWLRDELSRLSVDVSYLIYEKMRATISKTRIVSRHQQFIRFDEETSTTPPNDFVAFISGEIEKIFHNISLLIITDYDKGTVTFELSQLLIRTARKKDIPVIVDPKGKDYSKYSGAMVCTPNIHELELATNQHANTEADIHTMALKLCQDIEIKYLIVTRSEKGISLIRNRGNKSDFPVVPKEVIDVAGAGDTVVAVLALGLSSGMSIEDCCILANQAASVVISKFGTACISLAELMVEALHLDSVKQVERGRVSQLANDLRQLGKKIVFTNGCFDLIHAGHLASFTQARSFGDVLFVGLNSDASVKRIKGKNRPIIDEKHRAVLLCGLTCVDYVVIFDEDTPSNLLKEIKPDVAVKGKDWENKYLPEHEIVRGYGGRVEYIELEQGLSTTSIIQKIKGTQGSL